MHQTFIRESAAKLTRAGAGLEKSGELDGAARGELFRLLHTFKGTAQTFGLTAAGRLAHELENVLAAAKNNPAAGLILGEGLKILVRSLEEEDFELPPQFQTKLRQFAPVAETTAGPEATPAQIPGQFFARLSAHEKSVVKKELETGRGLFCLEVVFELGDFTNGLKSFREILSEKGTIIATFPGQNAPGRIGFQLLVASSLDRREIEAAGRDFSAGIIFASAPPVFPDDLPGILARIVAHGRELAEELGKRVEFETADPEFDLSDAEKKLVFEILLHLIRNAVDHAFEKSGRIEIELNQTGPGLRIRVSDDGRGLDLEKIRRRAVEKGLLSPKKILTEKATRDLIFQSEFSTATEITGLSGRGVGLDAVRELTEKSGGQINVTSHPGKGTTFEIFLGKGEKDRQTDKTKDLF